ncbi:hypothetical protein D3C87_1433590 [compost metagenome]
MQQVAVRGVQLDGVKAQADGAARAVHEGIAHARQASFIQRQRRRFGGFVRNGRRRPTLPAAFGRRHQLATVPGRVAGRLAAGMAQLDAQLDGRIAAYRGHHAAQRRLGLVRPQPQVSRRYAAIGLHRGGFGKEQRRAGQGQMTQMDHVPIGGTAVFGRVFAHGCDDDAIGQRDIADRRGTEQVTHGRLRAWDAKA